MKVPITARKELIRRHAALKGERERWLPHWREISDYLLPHHGIGLSGRSSDKELSGDKRMQNIFDGTALRAMRVLSAGLMGGLTSPSRPWFRLSLPDQDLYDRQDVKEWLFQVEERMRAVLAKSTGYTALHHTYSELAGFGTGAMGMFESFDKVVHFRPMTVGEYMLAVDSRGVVDSCYRELNMTARQMVQEFGEDNVSHSVRNSYRNGGGENRFFVIHIVEPNTDELDLPQLVGTPFRSVYFEKGGEDDKILRVSGYEEFPFLTPRWFVVGCQVYGRSPGMEVLPDVKQLQKETKAKLKALDKMVDPPLRVPGHPNELTINTTPGGLTYDVPAGLGGATQGIGPLYQVQPDMNGILIDIQDLRSQIREGLFNDLFMMMASQPTNSQMTAREVAERHEEKMVMLGPVLERLHGELLGPMIDRLFSIMHRVDMIPEPPEDLQGQELKVEFISILAQAQKMMGIGAVDAFAGFVGGLANLKPDVLDKVDFDEAVNVYADRTGVPPSILVPDDEVAEGRQQRAQMELAQQALAETESAARAAKDLSAAQTTDPSMLQPVAGMMGIPGVPG